MSQDHRRGIVSVVLLAALAVMLWNPAASLAADPEGEWVGKVKGPDKKDVEVKLAMKNEAGTWKASLTDQTLGEVTLTDVKVTGNSISFKFQPEGVPYPATFAGIFDPEHDRLSGTFAVRGSSRFVKFKRISGGDIVVKEEEPKEPARIRHGYKFGLNGRLSQWAALHVVKDEVYNINAATKSTLNYDGAVKLYIQDGFCLYGRYYHGGQDFTDDPAVIGQWPELGISSGSYLKLDGWEVGVSGFFGNKLSKTSNFNPYLTAAAGQVSWELDRGSRGSDVVVLERNALEGTDLALSFGLGTEYDINQQLQLEFEVVWRYFLTEDDTVWPDVDNNWSNTHVWGLSFGATYGLF